MVNLETLILNNNKIVDPFGRTINYLRLSITDHCNLACTYCREEDHKTTTKKKDILSYEEIHRLVSIFCDLGVSKVRLTGGEPLLRRDIVKLIDKLANIDGLKELPLSTNAVLLPKYAQEIKGAGITRLNVSIDTLSPEKFSDITRGGNIEDVILGIDAAIKSGFKSIKINMVVMSNTNTDDITEMLDFAIEKGIDVRFIETMPIGVAGIDALASHISQNEILMRIEAHLGNRLTPHTSGPTDGPATVYSIDGTNSKVGIIGAVSSKFCSSCNRIRLTAKGVLILCLGQENSLNLKDCIINGDSDEEIRDKILSAISHKPKEHYFETDSNNIGLVQMVEIGG